MSGYPKNILTDRQTDRQTDNGKFIGLSDYERQTLTKRIILLNQKSAYYLTLITLYAREVSL